jgi:hypothetical protein
MTTSIPPELPGVPRDAEGPVFRTPWEVALERIVAEKGLVATADLARRKREWDAAARATPRGRPIELDRT